MNEKHIRELAIKAGMIPGPIANTSPVHTWRESTDNPGAMERFAQLIVQECADIVDKMDSIRLESFHRADGSKVVIGDVLKQHFGVK